MISKELLSEVLKINGVSIRNILTSDIKKKGCYLGASTNLVYAYEGRNDKCGESTLAEINLYELAHKCKEWACLNRYQLKTYYSDTNREVNAVDGAFCFVWLTNYRTSDYNEVFACESTTEPEAIFKACEWILEQSNDKQS